MLDWQKVEAPTLFPWRCVACQNQKDLYDTNAETPGDFHVYLCTRCLGYAARKEGWLGPDAEKLLNSGDRIKELTKERDTYKTQRDKANEKIRALKKAEAELVQELDTTQGRVIQLQSRLAANAKADLELIGGDAA